MFSSEYSELLMNNADEAERDIVEAVIHSHTIGCLNEANIIQTLIENEGRFGFILIGRNIRFYLEINS